MWEAQVAVVAERKFAACVSDGSVRHSCRDSFATESGFQSLVALLLRLEYVEKHAKETGDQNAGAQTAQLVQSIAE